MKIGEMEWRDWWRCQVQDIYGFEEPEPHCKVCFYPRHHCKTACPGKAYYAPGQPRNPDGTLFGVRLPKGYKLPPEFANWKTPKRNTNHPSHSPHATMSHAGTARSSARDPTPSSAGTRLPIGTHDRHTTSSSTSGPLPSDHLPHGGHGNQRGRNNQSYRASTGRRISRSNTNSRSPEEVHAKKTEFGDRGDRRRSSNVSSRDPPQSYHTYTGFGGGGSTERRGGQTRLSYIREDEEGLKTRKL